MKVNIEVVSMVSWQNVLQYDNLIRHIRLLLYTQLRVVGEEGKLIKVKRNRKFVRITKEEKKCGGGLACQVLIKKNIFIR